MKDTYVHRNEVDDLDISSSLHQDSENLRESESTVPLLEPSVPATAEHDSGKLIYTAVELMTLGNIEPKYLLKLFFPQKGSAVLAGKPDIGKSQLARQLCIQVALGEKIFLDFELTPVHNKAIYLATEDNLEATTF